MYQKSNYLIHYGTKGQKWGVRKYQNLDGSLTALGRSHYGYGSGRQTSATNSNPYNLRIAGQGSNVSSGGASTTKSNNSTISNVRVTGLGTVDDGKKKEVEANGKWKPLDLESGSRIQTYEYGGRMYISDEDGQFMLDVGASSSMTYDYLKNTIAPMLNEAAKARASKQRQAAQYLKLGDITKEQYDKLMDQFDAEYAQSLANTINKYAKYAPDTNSISYKINTVINKSVSSLVSTISSLSKTASSTINKIANKTLSNISKSYTSALNWLEKKGIVTTKSEGDVWIKDLYEKAK